MWDRSVGHTIRLLTGIDLSEVFNDQLEQVAGSDDTQQLVTALLALCEMNVAQGLDPAVSRTELTEIVNSAGGFLKLPNNSDNGRRGLVPKYTPEQIQALKACYEVEQHKTPILHSKTIAAKFNRIKNVRTLIDGQVVVMTCETRKGRVTWFKASVIK
jgi:hypothetical protein